MTFRRVARFHPHRDQSSRASAWSRMLVKVALRLLDLVAISITIVLVAVPFVWTRQRASDFVESWSQSRFSEVALLEKDWMTLPRLPKFTRGDEPQLQAFLQAHPLIMAIQDRSDAKPLWVRSGDCLLPAPETPATQTIRQWFTKAEQAQGFILTPSEALPDEARSGPKIVFLGDQYLVAKRWKEGSPEVEQFLRSHLSAARPLRLMLQKEGDESRLDLQPQPWGQEPNFQADPYRIGAAPFSSQLMSNTFPGWFLTLIPTKGEAQAYRHFQRQQFTLAAAMAGLLGGALLLALYLRHRARRKAALDAHRMASMTHSLKTPLAILKFRCDTLRLGRFSPDELDAQLIQIGEEADRLAGIIENALMAIQGTPEAGPQQDVTAEWLAGIKEDLEPAFEAAGRTLVLAVAGQGGRAALPSLRAALYTLVENALYHGEGTVTVETEHTRNRLLIRVSDQGSGLDSLELKSLGRPFMRIRDKGREGFSKEGLGLGLSLLTKVVEREGWGLTFASEPGKGLCATLELDGRCGSMEPQGSLVAEH